ncbi:MAG: hypothetical protein A2068_10895 [Ignavibacteria bacterium GWB2_35_6b]|nr:MAG: hypothetical protein A2068_10895 [Ignavibacteria bacterium GWB2_35_6b]
MNLIEILTVILFLSSISLCFALIYFHYRIVKSVHSISLNIEEISRKLKPLIESAHELSLKLSSISNEAEYQLQTTRSIINDIKYGVDKIINFETIIPSMIVNAILPYLKNIKAVGKGVGSFWSKLISK